MNVKTIFIIHSTIFAFFAIALFFIPDILWPLYGVEVNDEYARFLSQHNSIFLGGIAIIAFLFRDIESNSTVARKLIVGLLWTNLLGILVTLYACFKGVFVGFGWSDPAFFSVMAALCVWQLKQPRAMA